MQTFALRYALPQTSTERLRPAPERSGWGRAHAPGHSEQWSSSRRFKAMTDNEEPQVSESQIAVHWREEDYYYPPEAFVRQANANDPAILERFTEDKFPDCFTAYAELLTWEKRWDTVLDTSKAPFWKWFVGGRLNASYNCVDRHAAANPDKTAIVFVPELESDEHVHISYGELLRQVNEFAALLRDFAGLKAGDGVTLHMPMVAEAAGHHARLCTARRHPLGGVRRLQRPCLRDPHRGLRKPGSDHHGRLLPGWLADRSQGQGRPSARGGGQGGPGGRQGARVAAPPGPVRFRDPHGGGPGLLRRRGAGRLPRQGGRAGLDARRGSTVPHVHQRDHRPSERLPAQHRRLPRVRGRHVKVLPGHPPRRRVLVHGGHRVDHRPLIHRVWPARARHHNGDLRGRAQLPRRWQAVADSGNA